MSSARAACSTCPPGAACPWTASTWSCAAPCAAAGRYYPAGTSLGAAALVQRAAFPPFTALEDARLFSLSLPAFDSLCTRHPHLGVTLYRCLTGQPGRSLRFELYVASPAQHQHQMPTSIQSPFRNSSLCLLDHPHDPKIPRLPPNLPGHPHRHPDRPGLPCHGPGSLAHQCVNSSASDANRTGLINAIKSAAAQGEDWRMVYQEAGCARDYLGEARRRSRASKPAPPADSPTRPPPRPTCASTFSPISPRWQTRREPTPPTACLTAPLTCGSASGARGRGPRPCGAGSSRQLRTGSPFSPGAALPDHRSDPPCRQPVLAGHGRDLPRAHPYRAPGHRTDPLLGTIAYLAVVEGLFIFLKGCSS